MLPQITIAVPPALPACLTIATVFSLRRFRKRDVYVTSPERIAFAGQVGSEWAALPALLLAPPRGRPSFDARLPSLWVLRSLSR